MRGVTRGCAPSRQATGFEAHKTSRIRDPQCPGGASGSTPGRRSYRPAATVQRKHTIVAPAADLRASLVPALSGAHALTASAHLGATSRSTLCREKSAATNVRHQPLTHGTPALSPTRTRPPTAGPPVSSARRDLRIHHAEAGAGPAGRGAGRGPGQGRAGPGRGHRGPSRGPGRRPSRGPGRAAGGSKGAAPGPLLSGDVRRGSWPCSR